MTIVAELWRFLRQRRKLWLFPLVLISLAIGVLLIVAKGSAFAPFIYTLF